MPRFARLRLHLFRHPRAQAGCFSFTPFVTFKKEVQSTLLIANPNFIGASFKVEPAFIFHFLPGVAWRNYFDTYLRSDGKHFALQASLNPGFGNPSQV